MAVFNQNFEAIKLEAGTTYGLYELGNGISASTTHQVFCVSAGTITIVAKGGGSFTWPATAGQSIDVMAGKCIVVSGEFVGFKSGHASQNQGTYYRNIY